MKPRFREFLEAIDPSWEYDETGEHDLYADAQNHIAEFDAAQDRIRLLEEALAYTRKYFDKPACEVDHGYTDYVVKWIDSLLEESK